MANEITIQAALTLQRDVVGVQMSATKPITQSPGTKGLVTQLSVSNIVGGSAIYVITIVPSAPLSSLGMLFLKNMDANLSCDVSRDNNFAATSVFATLKPGEFCLIPVNQTPVPDIRIRASGVGPIAVVVCATEI